MEHMSKIFDYDIKALKSGITWDKVLIMIFYK